MNKYPTHHLSTDANTGTYPLRLATMPLVTKPWHRGQYRHVLACLSTMPLVARHVPVFPAGESLTITQDMRVWHAALSPHSVNSVAKGNRGVANHVGPDWSNLLPCCLLLGCPIIRLACPVALGWGVLSSGPLARKSFGLLALSFA